MARKYAYYSLLIGIFIGLLLSTVIYAFSHYIAMMYTSIDYLKEEYESLFPIVSIVLFLEVLAYLYFGITKGIGKTNLANFIYFTC